MELARPRLSRLLSAAARLPVTVVVGLPGSGKTHAVRQWVDALPPGESRYLAVDPGIGAPDRFWSAVLEQVRGQDAGAGARRPVPATTRRTAVAALHTSGGPLTLVVDQADNIAADTDIRALCDAGQALPGGCHIVLLARSEARLPLHRLRLAGAVAEIGDDELCFDADETASLLALMQERPAQREEARALQRDTEGWALPLALVAEAAEREGSAQAALERVVAAADSPLTRTIDAALAAHPADLGEFLGDVCILDRLSAPLCDAVSGRRDSHAVLQRLRDANLFIRPLGADRGWYRCQPVVRAVLRQRLRVTQPQRERRLHVAAIRWWEPHGAMLDVARHQLERGARGAAYTALLRHADDCLDTGKPPSDGLRAEAFGPGYIERSGERMAGWASYLLAAGRREEAAPWLRRATPSSRRSTGDALAGLRLARAWCVYRELRGDIGETLEAARAMQRAAVAARQDGALVRAAVARIRALTWSGQAASARQSYAGAAAISQPSRPGQALLFAVLSQVACAEGRLHEAEELAALALEEGGDDPQGRTEAVDAWLTRGEVLAERNQLDAAADALQVARDKAERLHSEPFAVLSLTRMATVLFAGGLQRAAFETLAAARELRAGIEADPLSAQVDAVEARLRALAGNLDRAASMLTHLPEGAGRKLLAARLALARGDRAEAEACLREAAAASRTVRDEVEAGVLRAVLASREDDRAAETALARAVDRARPEEYVRVFVDEGGAVMRLLRRLRSRDPSSYLRDLVAAGHERRGALRPQVAASQALDLTERERAVLHYFPSRLSYQQIGTELFISLNTVKTHAKGIFRKLGVSTRAEAVAKARALGLLRRNAQASPREG